MEAVARAVLGGDEDPAQLEADTVKQPASVCLRSIVRNQQPAVVDHRATAQGRVYNLGGFTDGGRSYTIVLEGNQETPLPWANVIANARFGTIVTASGSGHTWSENSRENRLTSFANDPVVDPTAEALFIRDDDSGDAWSPTPGRDTHDPSAVRRSAFSCITRSRVRREDPHYPSTCFVDVDDP